MPHGTSRLRGWGGRRRQPRPVRLLAAALTGLAVFSLFPAATVQAGARLPRSAGAGISGFLNDVLCISRADCWALGTRTTSHGKRDVGLVEHWNGSTWSAVTVPEPSGPKIGGSHLGGISCTGPADCWAIGSYLAPGPLPYAERWDGTRWSLTRLPHPAGSPIEFLGGPSCPSPASCWAVGIALAGPLIEHWNGQRWLIVPAPRLPRTVSLERTFCTSVSNCWAVGARQSSGTATAHWNGHIWTMVRTPTSAHRQDLLSGIFCATADACMAVGVQGQGAGRAVAERWTGTAWQVTSTGDAPVSLESADCISAASCLAVGTRNPYGNGLATAERWNGTGWQVLTVPRPAGASDTGLTAISCITAADCWAVGNEYNAHIRTGTILIMHWNGHAWSIGH